MKKILMAMVILCSSNAANAIDNNFKISLNLKREYDLKQQKAENLVLLAEKYADDVFPKKKDILAIAAVESEFDYRARNSCCHGLLQVNFSEHREKIKGNLQTLYNPSENIKVAVKILKEYYLLVGKDKEKAIQAYNIGITAFKNGRKAKKYLNYANLNFYSRKTLIYKE